jgi:hypothetical protein
VEEAKGRKSDLDDRVIKGPATAEARSLLFMREGRPHCSVE